MDLISVIIPTFNRENNIMACIQNILMQTYDNIEVIVVDDASTDKTEYILQRNNDSRVHYFKYDINQGACYARNYGFKMSKGKYIAFQDSDDLWRSNKLELQMKLLTESNADFVFCGMMRNNCGKIYYEPLYEFDNEKNVLAQLLARNAASTQTMLMKRDVLNKVEFDTSFKRFQDWDFIVQVAINGFKIRYLNETLVDSVILENSISNVIDAGKARQHFYDKYKNLYNDFPEAKAVFFADTAKLFTSKDKKNAHKYLNESLKAKWKISTVVKMILNYTSLWVKLEGNNFIHNLYNGVGDKNIHG